MPDPPPSPARGCDRVGKGARMTSSTMQNPPLLLSTLLDRGASLQVRAPSPCPASPASPPRRCRCRCRCCPLLGQPRRLLGQPDNEIVTLVEDGYHRITYAQHMGRVHRLASALSSWGLQVRAPLVPHRRASPER